MLDNCNTSEFLLGTNELKKDALRGGWYLANPENTRKTC